MKTTLNIPICKELPNRILPRINIICTDIDTAKYLRIFRCSQCGYLLACGSSGLETAISLHACEKAILVAIYRIEIGSTKELIWYRFKCLECGSHIMQRGISLSPKELAIGETRNER